MSRNPMAPLGLTAEEVKAIQAVSAGQGSEYQQGLAIRTIIERICETDITSFISGPDGDRLTAVAEGKRWVGIQLRNITVNSLKKLADLSRQVKP